MLGVAPHVLRYWESQFRGIRPKKSRSGQRIYSRRDVEALKQVKGLVHDDQYKLEGARRKLREGGIEPPPPEAVAAAERAAGVLVGVREELVRLIAELS